MTKRRILSVVLLLTAIPLQSYAADGFYGKMGKFLQQRVDELRQAQKDLVFSDRFGSSPERRAESDAYVSRVHREMEGPFRDFDIAGFAKHGWAQLPRMLTGKGDSIIIDWFKFQKDLGKHAAEFESILEKDAPEVRRRIIESQLKVKMTVRLTGSQAAEFQRAMSKTMDRVSGRRTLTAAVAVTGLLGLGGVASDQLGENSKPSEIGLSTAMRPSQAALIDWTQKAPANGGGGSGPSLLLQ